MYIYFAFSILGFNFLGMVHFAAVSYDQFDQYKILICPSTELCNAAEFHGNNPTTEWDQIFPLICKPEATCELMILDVPFREVQSPLSLEQQNQKFISHMVVPTSGE